MEELKTMGLAEINIDTSELIKEIEQMKLDAKEIGVLITAFNQKYNWAEMEAKLKTLKIENLISDRIKMNTINTGITEGLLY